MCHAWTHYIHGVCTSGHPLWRCSKQPIIYSTLISTHVNPHQSSHARGDCCGSHTASWQSTRGEPEKTLLGMIRTCRQTRRAPPKGLQPALLSKLIRGAQREKVSRRGADWPRFGPLPGPRNTPKQRASRPLESTVTTTQRQVESGAGGIAQNTRTRRGKGTTRDAQRLTGRLGRSGKQARPRLRATAAPAQTTASRTRPRETPACVVSLFGTHLLAHRSQRRLCQTSRPSAPSLNVLTKTSLRNVNREHSVCGFQRLISVISLATMKTSARTTETQRTRHLFRAGTEAVRGKQTWHLHFIVFYWKGFPGKHRLTLFCHIRVTCYYYLHVAKIMKNLSNK